MKKILKSICITLAIIIAIFFFNIALNLTLYNPAIIVPLYGWAEKYHLMSKMNALVSLAGFGEVNDPYPLTSIGRLESNTYREPRASITGTVEAIVKAVDGDYHVNIRDEKNRILVTEMVPEYPLPLPTVGQKIKIWGVTRYDLGHRWWELHPVFGWEPK